MPGQKTVQITCNYTIARNPQDWVEENKKSLQALQTGIENQMIAEIERLKRITAIASQPKNIAIEADIHEHTGVVLDYLYLQLHAMFPDRHILPSISYSAHYIRQATRRIEAKTTKQVTPPASTRKRIPRKYCVGLVVVTLLAASGFLVVLLWALLTD
jgi:hypothetical protein